jgi:hypothetical protein
MNEDFDRTPHYRDTLLALMLTGLVGGGLLLFLIFITGGFFLYVLLVVLALAALGCLHYLVWGAWASQATAAEREELEFRDWVENGDDWSQPDPHRPRHF